MDTKRIGLLFALLACGIAGDAAADCGVGYQSLQLELIEVDGVDASALDAPESPRVTNAIGPSGEDRLVLAWEQDGSARSMNLEGP